MEVCRAVRLNCKDVFNQEIAVFVFRFFFFGSVSPKRVLAGHLFFVLKVALMNNKVLLNHCDCVNLRL